MKSLKNAVLDIPVIKMRPGDNTREDPREEELLSLGQSLIQGQIHPIILFEDAEEYVIFDGWRRWLAALKVGLVTLKAIIIERPSSESERMIAQAASSIHRADLSGWEKYQLCYGLVQLNTNWLGKDVAKALNVNPSMVSRLLSPSKCIKPIRDALQVGLIGISDCYEFSQVPEYEQEELLRLKMSGKSRDEVASIRRNKSAEPQSTSTVRTARMKCALPSGACITISGQDLSLSDAAEALGEAQKAIRKAIADGLDAKTWQAVMRDKAKAG